MRVDSSEYPAQDIVLLDNVGQQRKRRGGFKHFAFVDHEAAAFKASGTQSRQAVTSFSDRSAGSSLA